MQVHAACDFLAGQCAEMKDQLEEQMRKAAAQLDFEKAAELRDLIQDIESTTRKVHPFARIPYSLPVAIDPQQDLEELARALGLPEPPGSDRGIRHLEHQRHVRRRLDGRVPKWPAGPGRLSEIQNAHRDRPG
jgi:hypothetical protein